MGEKKLVRLEKSRQGGLMVKEGREFGFPDRKFEKEVAGLRSGDEINIEVTGHLPAKAVFFWHWVKDDRPEEVQISFDCHSVVVKRDFSTPLGVRRTEKKYCDQLEEAIRLGIEKTDAWLAFEEYAREKKERAERVRRAKEAGPTGLEFKESHVVFIYGDGSYKDFAYYRDQVIPEYADDERVKKFFDENEARDAARSEAARKYLAENKGIEWGPFSFLVEDDGREH